MIRHVVVAAALAALSGACVAAPESSPTTVPPAAGTTTTVGPTPSSTLPVVDDLPDVPSGPEVVGMSASGRPLVAVQFGTGPARVYVVGGIHGDERSAVENSRALLTRLRTAPPDGVTIRWLLDANPDGTATGSRDNGHGVDINRNWPTGHIPSDEHGTEPLSEPETRALDAELAAFGPDVVVAFHAAREGPFADHDGPGEQFAHAFAAGASLGRQWEVVPEVDWPTPGSLGTHVGGDLGIPVVTVEANRWDSPAAALPELAAGLDALLAAATGAGFPVSAPVCADHRVGNACSETTRRAAAVLADGVTGGTSGFLVKEAGGVVLAARWADHPTYPASTIKIVHYLHVHRTAADLDAALATPVAVPDDPCGRDGSRREPLGTLMSRMMIDSDNQATNAIQQHVGLEALEATILAAGMPATGIHHAFGCGGPANDPANHSTAADLVALYDGVTTGTLLAPDRLERFLDGMADITAGVLAELESDPRIDTRIVAKAGWYERNLSIAGIAETQAGVFVFAAYVDRARAIAPDFTIERVVAELLRAPITGSGE